MKKPTKAILVLSLALATGCVSGPKVDNAPVAALGAAVAASLLLDIPGGKWFKRYCSYPDMKALMDAEKDDITAWG